MSDKSKEKENRNYSEKQTAKDESARGLPPTENKVKMPEVKPAKQNENDKK